VKATLTDEAFARLRDLLADKAGLVFDVSRRDSLSYAVAERMQATGIALLDDYIDAVVRPRTTELQALLDEATIPETYFFRNAPQFRALRQHVLPELVRHASRNGRKIRVWSAGCSTGEEAYSLAILLRAMVPTGDWDIKVIATDISTKALAAAERGRYGTRSMGPVDEPSLERWFTPVGDEHEVRPEVRELVEFRHHNLVADAPPLPDKGADLVLCRNVTIYFARETTRALMTRLHASLRPGGYLFLGHSETLWQVSEDFQLVTLGEAFVYRRELPGQVAGGEKRAVLPDRRTTPNDPPAARRTVIADRRDAVVPVQRAPMRPAHRPVEPALAVPPASLDDARKALKAGDYEHAAEAAAAISGADPLRADAYTVRALALTNLGRHDDALADLRKAVYVDPRAGFAQFLLGGTLARLGDELGAARAYRAAAQTLGHSADDHVAAEMGGRKLDELIELCWQLAGGRP
jgi:chemotaxis protein methyltransferase CheR